MVASCLIAALAIGGPVAPPAPLLVQINYDETKVPSDPDYGETIANLTYPLAKGPTTMGYPTEPLPVMLWFRGGNSNNLVAGVLSNTITTATVPELGMIGVDCNYPIVGPDEDYTAAVRGVGMLVQFLRTNAAALNVDPDRILTHGRSFGAVVGYGLAFREDYRDLSSPNVTLHASSRPNYWIARLTTSSLTCFTDNIGSWGSTLSTFFFPGKTFEQASEGEKLRESPYWWLLNPHLFQREFTPPVLIVHKKNHGHVCGQVNDVHSGLFGDIMLEAMTEYSRTTGDHQFLERSTSIDHTSDPLPEILAWSVKRLADDYEGLHLVPPAGAVGTTGGNVSLRTYGAVPGSTVTFYTGTQAGTFPLPGCPGVDGQITDFVELGTAVATPGGFATLTFAVSGASLGKQVLFHAVDFATCETSNVAVHVYY